MSQNQKNALRPDIDTVIQRMRDRGMELEASVVESNLETLLDMIDELRDSNETSRQAGASVFSRMKYFRAIARKAKQEKLKQRRDNQKAANTRHERERESKDRFIAAVRKRAQELALIDWNRGKDEIAKLIDKEGDLPGAPRPRGTSKNFIRKALEGVDL